MSLFSTISQPSRVSTLALALCLSACGGGQSPMTNQAPTSAALMPASSDPALRRSMGAGDAASDTPLSKPLAVTGSTLGGSTELLWHNAGTGQTVSWAMSGTTASSSNTLLQAPNWKLVQSADLNGDGQQDLIWENGVTQQHVAWLMNGAQTLQSTVLLQLPGWKLSLTADFNGDGKADLLWHNAATGQTVLWLMNGTTAQSSQVLFTSTVWQVSHVADLNGDGKADLIWRNSQSGQTAAWLMNGTSVLSSGSLLDLSAWRVSHVGDLDGDGRDDLVWVNAGTGQTVLWLMNGLTTTSSTQLFAHPSWRVSRVADLDGDGKADLLWTHSGTGEVAAWLMNGASIKGNAVLLANPSWQLTQTMDLNGDGRQDLIWRHANSGQTVAWLMNGLTATSQSTLLSLPGWEVVGQRASAAPASPCGIGKVSVGGRCELIRELVTASPSTLNLGTQRQNTTSIPQRVSVSNTGNVPFPLQLTSWVGFRQPPGYVELLTYQFKIGNSTCPEMLAVGASCTFEVSFSSAGGNPLVITPPSIPDTPSSELIESEIALGGSVKVPVTVSVKLMNADAKACIQVGVKRGSTAEFDSQTITNICNAPVYVHWCHAPSSRSGTASSVCGYKGGALYFGHSTVLAPGASNDNFYTMPVDATLFYGACSGAFMTQLGDGKYACNKP